MKMKKHVERLLAVKSVLRGIDYLNDDIEEIKNELRYVADAEENEGVLENIIFEIGLDAIAESLEKIRK